MRRLLRPPHAAHAPRRLLFRRGRPGDGHSPGTGQDQIAAFQGGFTSLIRQFVVTALELHELPADEDPDSLTFELNGIILAANTNFVLRQDPAALDMARNIVRRRLGITTTTTPPTNGTKSRPPEDDREQDPTAAIDAALRSLV